MTSVKANMTWFNWHNMSVKQTEMIGSHGEFKVVLGVQSLSALQVQHESSIVDQHRELLTTSMEIVDKRSDWLQVRKVQLQHSNQVCWSNTAQVQSRCKIKKLSCCCDSRSYCVRHTVYCQTVKPVRLQVYEWLVRMIRFNG